MHAGMPESDRSDAPRSGVEIAPGVVVPEAVLHWSASRSSGPGGQNVNKVSSRMELRLALADLPLSPRVIDRLARLAGRKVTDQGELVILADEHRSQPRNKGAALDRLRELIVQAKVEPKIRRATKPTRGSQERRIEAKKGRSQVKAQRRRPGTSE